EATKPAELPRREYVWIDDALPAGAREVSDGGVNGRWDFVAPPAPPAGGGKAVRRTAEGLGQVVFQDANPGLRVGTGDVLFAHVYLDRAKPPREIMRQWHTDDWKHRAYWGDNRIDWGRDGTGERRLLGPLPAAGQWVRLEVPVGKVGLKPGAVVNGWAFTQFDGTVYWDKSGLITRTPQGDQAFTSLAAWLQAQRTTGGASLPK